MKRQTKERVPKSIRGRVRDEAGRRSLHGVRVDLVAIEGKTKHILASAKTNTHGDFEMPLSTKRAVKLGPDSTLLVVHGIDGRGHGTVEVAVAWHELLSGTIEAYVTLPTATGPWISGVNPREVLPGSFVEIEGAGFGDDYSDVVAWAGGREMVVLDVQPTQLLVRIPPLPGDINPLVVSVAGQQAEMDNVFERAAQPYPSAVGTLGGPATFSGVADGGDQ